jgi:hypothetical protein
MTDSVAISAKHVTVHATMIVESVSTMRTRTRTVPAFASSCSLGQIAPRIPDHAMFDDRDEMDPRLLIVILVLNIRFTQIPGNVHVTLAGGMKIAQFECLVSRIATANQFALDVQMDGLLTVYSA